MNFLLFLKKIFTHGIQIAQYTLPFNLLELLVKFVFPVILLIVTYKLIVKSVRNSIAKSKLREDRKLAIVKWTRAVLQVLLLVVFVLLTINLFGAEISYYLSIFGDALTLPIIKGISVITILLIIPIIYLARVGGRVTEKFVSSSILPYLKIKDSSIQLVSGVIKNIAFVVIILFGLTLIGFNLSLLYGLFGIIGIGIGFGLQGLVGNLFAGMIMLTTKPVKVGDHILVDGTEGDLVEIRFISSVVSTIGHESIIIPNSKLIENPVRNYSFDDRNIIIKNSVQVSYESDLDMVLDVLATLVKMCPYNVKGKEIECRVVSFDDSGITLSTICWIENSSDKYKAKSWINLEIWRTFRDKGIEIPYPKLNMTITKG
ncbi:MAG: hypothetical protein B6229_02770 [Spirochaetaceae bacterium 4572_7]|nr:MAG: hypothetical protein B6229_02770 [Spirochaetaceae bacterium 4572_7]